MARIIVVDDDQDILNLIQLRLGKAGHTVEAFGDGPSALAGLAGPEPIAPPDVAVLDVTMPGMSGLELLHAIREREGLRDLPAVFLSARVLPEEIAAGEAMGATYLTKPFVAPVLLQAVEHALLPPAERNAQLTAVMGVPVRRPDAGPDAIRFTHVTPPPVAHTVSKPPPGH